jgi:hypothetical protein
MFERINYGVWLCVDHEWTCIIVNDVVPVVMSDKAHKSAYIHLSGKFISYFRILSKRASMAHYFVEGPNKGSGWLLSLSVVADG